MPLVSSLETPQTWTWQGFPIAYRALGDRGPAVLLVHGFGASSGHWRQNMPALAESCRVYALDLIGFGQSAKPTALKPMQNQLNKPLNQSQSDLDPGLALNRESTTLPSQSSAGILYTFETWGQQIVDFCQQVIGEPVVLVGNSIGCIAAMQAAVMVPDLAQGVILLNCSLRLLHDRRRATQPWYKRLGAPILQQILQAEWIGRLFFQQVARPQTVRQILEQAYATPGTVTDELVELLLAPARDPGAVGVFLAFTGYSQGPLPEDLLGELPCPAVILWGTADPWEPVDLGLKLAEYPAVQEFVPLTGLGHCPHDEAPDRVNPLLLDWITHFSQLHR